MEWISLNTHSQFSILDSTASVKALAKRAKKQNMQALALTDFCNLYGAIDFYKACKSEGIKPIFGLEVIVAPESRFTKKRFSGRLGGYSIVLLAKNLTGYHHLAKLSSIAFLEGFYYTPRIDKEMLEKYKDGLIFLSGRAPLDEMEYYHQLFQDDFYAELQRHPMSDSSISIDKMDKETWLYQKYLDSLNKENERNSALLEFAKEKNALCVATNSVHYLDRDDWKAHEILMNVQSGEPVEIWEKDPFGKPIGRSLNPKRRVLPSHEHYFKTSEEMSELFKDIPEAITNTVKIAEKCDVTIDFDEKFYPVFYPPHVDESTISKEERVVEAENYLVKLCEEGITSRYTPERLAKVQEKYPGKDPLEVVKERLKYELDIICSKGMCDYLLIVHDFIYWAKGEGIPVGPGRGSGAGSIILYLIGITDIEPLRFNLFFERFINPERVSYPDIDVDICMERRGEVIEYTLKKYGKERVAQIITFGTMKAKMAIKDVGRVLSVPLSKVNAIAKLIPDEIGITLEKALEVDQDLRQMVDDDPEAKMVIDLAQKVEGSIRNTGVHAAGLIICGDPLTDHIPLCLSKDSDMAITQFSMKPVEAVGMLKIDFLGLKTLTSIQKAVFAIEENTENLIDWVNLPLTDTKTFGLLNHGKTEGVFQLESGGMQDLARKLHIDKFEEIIAVGALYRPGPMEMIPSFIDRKHGKEKISYDHPLVKDILDETYGIMVYQEQVMQIAQRLAGYSLGEGDVLRRAMGKKDHAEMGKQRVKFQDGSEENGIENETANEIFNKIEKFASYGFNKSHAAAYGYLSYVTAFLKANYPKEWMGALMTCDMDDLSKVAKHIRESKGMGIEILSPNVNESNIEFVATKDGVRFAMSGIKGVGRGVVELIVKERKQNGPYQSLLEFFKRVDTKKVGKKVVENLIGAGSFDFTGWSRRSLLANCLPMFEVASREQKEKEKGVLDLFAALDDGKSDNVPLVSGFEEEFAKQDLLRKEKELLGFYLTGHPMDEFKNLMKNLCCVPFDKIPTLDHGAAVRIAAIIESAKIRTTIKGGRKFAILVISNGVERFELPIWPSVFEEKAHLIEENQLIFLVVQIEKDSGECKLQCRFMQDLTQMDEVLKKEADDAYDLAIKDAKRSFHIKKNGAKKASKDTKDPKKASGEMKVEKKEKESIDIFVDVNLTTHTKILKIKKVFSENPGKTAVKLHFTEEEKEIATVLINSSSGVEYSEDLLKELATISSLKVST